MKLGVVLLFFNYLRQVNLIRNETPLSHPHPFRLLDDLCPGGQAFDSTDEAGMHPNFVVKIDPRYQAKCTTRKNIYYTSLYCWHALSYHLAKKKDYLGVCITQTLKMELPIWNLSPDTTVPCGLIRTIKMMVIGRYKMVGLF